MATQTSAGAWLGRTIGWGIVGLGTAHVLVTPEYVPNLGVEGLWFASGGGAFMLVGALNLLRLRYGRGAKGLRSVCLLANVGTLAFLAALAIVARAGVGSEPQVFLAIALIATATVVALAAPASAPAGP